MTSLGKYMASWTRKLNEYTLQLSVPEGTSGNLTLPYVTPSQQPQITIDGNRVTRGVVYNNQTSTATVGVDGGGSHKVIVR